MSALTTSLPLLACGSLDELDMFSTQLLLSLVEGNSELLVGENVQGCDAVLDGVGDEGARREMGELKVVVLTVLLQHLVQHPDTLLLAHHLLPLLVLHLTAKVTRLLHLPQLAHLLLDDPLQLRLTLLPHQFKLILPQLYVPQQQLRLQLLLNIGDVTLDTVDVSTRLNKFAARHDEGEERRMRNENEG